MIKISNNIQIKEVQVADFKILNTLMNDVYKDAYKDFWKDGGDWYVQNQFSKSNLENEL